MKKPTNKDLDAMIRISDAVLAGPLFFNDIVRKTSLDSKTVQRILQKLVKTGAVVNDKGQWKSAIKVVELQE